MDGTTENYESMSTGELRAMIRARGIGRGPRLNPHLLQRFQTTGVCELIHDKHRCGRVTNKVPDKRRSNESCATCHNTAFRIGHVGRTPYSSSVTVLAASADFCAFAFGR